MNGGKQWASARDWATWLYRWLCDRETDVLPRLVGIASAAPYAGSVYSVDTALRQLRKAGLIAWRTGTRSENRGHGAVRIIATGRILKTSGCPFDAPERSP
jgi:hypothetical protein